MPARSVGIVKCLAQQAIVVLSALLAAQLIPCAHAQDQPAVPTQPPTLAEQAQSASEGVTVKLTNQLPKTVYDNLALRGGFVCGGGVSSSSVSTKPTTQCGMLFGLDPFEIEFGVIGPQANRSDVSGYLSTNLWFPFHPNSTHGTPVVVGGYTRMFETGHAVDFGMAYLRPIRPIGGSRYVQFEVRDYWAFANPNQHNTVFRVMWIFGGGNEE